MIRTDLGIATAYAEAVSKGYTGTRDEFGQMFVDFGKTAEKVSEDKKAVEQMNASVEETKNSVDTTAAEFGQNVADMTAEAKAAITEHANTKKESVTAAISEAKDAATGAITEAQTSATGAIASAKDSATAEITKKGTDTLATIPADYTALSKNVSELKEDLGNIENDVSTLSQGYIPIKLIKDKFLTSSGIAGYTNWSATENIKIEGLDYIYTEWSKESSYNKFLDSSFGLVKMVSIKDGLHKTNVPEGSCYVAFSNETTVMEGLRVWSPTKINSYENTLEISKLKQDIPFYYEKHLTDKITEVRAKETFSGVNGDEFIFITDYHMEKNANNSPSLIDKIIHQTGAKKIVFGGDAYDASSTPDLALNKIADFYSMFYENADKILSCVGNHEYNNPASNKPEQQIPNGQVYASIVNRNDLILYSRHTCNYTVLNHSNKTIYIFIGCEYNSSITNESIKYVLETIKNNNGYDIIVFSHTGLDNGGDNGNVANIVSGFKRITDGIDKFNQKSSYIFDGITYDYSGCTGEVVCVFSGHNHVDGCIKTDGGLNVISTTCDAYGEPEGGVVRTKGTITEQAFDVVNIDYENKKIYMTRIGAGEDRTFSY